MTCNGRSRLNLSSLLLCSSAPNVRRDLIDFSEYIRRAPDSGLTRSANEQAIYTLTHFVPPSRHERISLSVNGVKFTEQFAFICVRHRQKGRFFQNTAITRRRLSDQLIELLQVVLRCRKYRVRGGCQALAIHLNTYRGVGAWM